MEGIVKLAISLGLYCMVNVINIDTLELGKVPKILICWGKMLPGIILVTISKYSYSTNHTLPLQKIYKKDFWINTSF